MKFYTNFLNQVVSPIIGTVGPRVSSGGIVRVRNNGYSVPSGLKGKQVTVRVYEWHIEVWYANQLVETMPRLTGINKHRINYRHVIDTLLRKPGGFRNYRHRNDLFPSSVFRRAWETLNQRLSPRRADIAYLHILKLAARGMESDVAVVLEDLLASNTAWNDQTVAERVQPQRMVFPNLELNKVDLSPYDQLLSGEVRDDAT